MIKELIGKMVGGIFLGWVFSSITLTLVYEGLYFLSTAMLLMSYIAFKEFFISTKALLSFCFDRRL